MAAGISAVTPLLRRRRRLLDAIAIVTSAAVAVMLIVIMVRVARGDSVYWFAGSRPSHGIAIGIDFDAGALSAGLASLAAVLVTASHPAAPFAAGSTGVTLSAVLTGVGSAAAGLALALLALYWRRLPVLRRGFEPGTGLVRPIRRLQSGVVNDYVTWVVIGLAGLGGALAFTIR